jgi:hypothetical protein
MDGASIIEDTWLRARAGEHGYLSGKDAEAAACDALIVPVVTGSPNWAVVSEMITLVTDRPRQALRVARGLQSQAGRLRCPPRQAQEARRQDHRQRLHALV